MSLFKSLLRGIAEATIDYLDTCDNSLDDGSASDTLPSIADPHESAIRFLSGEGEPSFSDDNGSWGYRNQDGSASYNGADGSWGYVSRDGSGSYNGADGSWGFRNPNGSGSYYGADGSWGYVNEDGSGAFYDSEGNCTIRDPNSNAF